MKNKKLSTAERISVVCCGCSLPSVLQVFLFVEFPTHQHAVRTHTCAALPPACVVQQSPPPMHAQHAALLSQASSDRNSAQLRLQPTATVLASRWYRRVLLLLEEEKATQTVWLAMRDAAALCKHTVSQRRCWIYTRSNNRGAAITRIHNRSFA